MRDPFETLGIEPSFRLPLAELEARHRELSRALHPDRHATAPPKQRREALGRAIEVNEALRALRDPAQRAEVLLRRIDGAVSEEPAASPTLLMEMMEGREALAEARHGADVARVEQLERAMRQREAGVLAELEAGFACALERPAVETRAIRVKLGELRYLRRFLAEAGAILDELC